MAVMVCVFLERAIRCGNDSGDSIYDERDLLVLLDKNSFILVPQSYKHYIPQLSSFTPITLFNFKQTYSFITKHHSLFECDSSFIDRFL